MTMAAARSLFLESIERWHVEIGVVKRGCEAGYVIGSNPNDKIDVQREARFSIDGSGQGSGDHIGDVELIQRPGEAAEELNERHGAGAG